MVRVGAEEECAASGSVAIDDPLADRVAEDEPVGAAELRVHLQAQVRRQHHRLLLKRLVHDALRQDAELLLAHLTQALDVLVRSGRWTIVLSVR